jgi:hypothetical protein
MFNQRRWRRGEGELESQLRAARAEPSDEFVDGIARQIQGAGRRPSAARAWSRIAFAGAFTTFVLGIFASVGGLGYAASGARHTYSLASQLAVHHRITVHHSAASDQYGSPPSQPSQNVAGKVAVQSSAGAEHALAASAQSTQLPLTGFSLLGTFIASGILMCLGLFLRRRGRSTS